ncbi:hypothetical protein FZEAL_2372 [Fusarium zealandicum]|uniref:Uncharacterized protein n=1 Tax=Fusarium zealandicum TaxID=1053134 RepID=A0A8H4URE8_9HYPO|nr:hypothetical protein FZEAL_2372 [Fusarium zealandicum]
MYNVPRGGTTATHDTQYETTPRKHPQIPITKLMWDTEIMFLQWLDLETHGAKPRHEKTQRSQNLDPDPEAREEERCRRHPIPCEALLDCPCVSHPSTAASIPWIHISLNPWTWTVTSPLGTPTPSAGATAGGAGTAEAASKPPQPMHRVGGMECAAAVATRGPRQASGSSKGNTVPAIGHPETPFRCFGGLQHGGTIEFLSLAVPFPFFSILGTPVGAGCACGVPHGFRNRIA